MTAEPCLVDLPAETLHAVIAELPFHDSCNLRLTSRDMAANVIQTSFKSYFATKTVEMSKDSLEAFSSMTKQAWVSSALKHLTITGMLSSAHDQGSTYGFQEHELLKHLENAFSDLRSHSEHGHLCSLTLDVKGSRYDGSMKRPSNIPDWHTVCDCASATALLTAKAVKASALSIERLDLFGMTQRCALALSDLGLIMETFGMQARKALSLTVCTSYHETAPEQERFPPNLMHILGPSKHLEHLELRWVRRRHLNTSDAELQDRAFFASTVDNPRPLPRLTSVSLRGIDTSQDQLLAFLRTYPGLTSLSLEEIRLPQGQFSPIFAYIDEHMKLNSLYLNDLWEKRLIQFLGVSGKCHFPYPGGPTWMKRTSQDRWRRIRYQPMRGGRIKGSPAADRWFARRCALYGPF
nr:hypothetical protein CFP56_31635 [Quercus suber]